MSNLEPKVALGDGFLQAFSLIPKNQQKAVMSFVTKFRTNPRASGINYELIRNASDPNFRSVRIDKNYRGIILKPERGNVYVLLWVDKHDDAYAWAERHRCQIHPTTGTLQLYETEHIIESQPTDDIQESSYDEASDGISEVELQALFDLEKDTLLSLGVPKEHLDLVQSLKTEEMLEKIESKLPIEAFEALYLLAAGTPFDEVWNDYAVTGKEGSVDISDFEKALEQPITQQRFRVPEDEQELGRMLNAPLERWRVFLHPLQRKLVERDWSGPVRVLGGAGTGKTVVAMHRAKWLVSRENWPKGARLLFTTFTSNLALDILESLKKICTAEQLQRIEVIHIDAWVSQFIKKNGYTSRIIYPGGKDGGYKRCWDQAISLAPMDEGFPEGFYFEEWQRVILTQQIRSKPEYFKAIRTGRGVALNRRQRADIWPVFEEMREQLIRNDYITAEDAMHQALEILQQGDDKRAYHAVVADEVQDFGTEALTLLRALVPEQKNDMFIVGDAHQRIYQRKTNFSQCGISIRGRGKKLRINYRTTELIRRFATALLEGEEIDDLDGGTDTSTDYRSLVVGQEPVIKQFNSLNEEGEWLAEQIKALEQEGVALSEVAVVSRTNSLNKSYQELLENHGIATYVLSRQKSDQRNQDGVRLATMHRVKGLEFRVIFIVSVNKGIVPLETATNKTEDVVEQRLKDLNERALFHVAATRAVKYLYVSSSGEPSEYIISSVNM